MTESWWERAGRRIYGRRPAIATSWTEADLACNRRGEISPAQRRAIAWWALRATAVSALLFALAQAASVAALVTIHGNDLVVWLALIAACTSLFPTGNGVLWLVRIARGRLDAVRGIHDLTRTPDDELERSIGGHFFALPYDFQLKLNVEVIAYVLSRRVVLAVERTDGQPVTW
nr:hypothetical protein [Kofleriaceae bacterium]